MSLSSCSYRPDQTRHALSRPSVVSPLSRTLFTFKTPIFKIFMAATANSLTCCVHLPHPLMHPQLIQRSIRRCRLPLVVFSVQLSLCLFFRLVRFGRSSCSYPFSSLLRQRSPRCCTTIRYFAFPFPHYLGCCFTRYRCICSIPIHSFRSSLSTAALFVPRSFRASPTPSALVQFPFLSRFAC